MTPTPTETKALVERLSATLKFYAESWQWDGKHPETTEPSGDLRDDLGAAARDFIHDDLPQILAALEPLTREPEGVEVERATSSADFHQRRGIALDIIDEALTAYNSFMLDDDYEFSKARDILDRMAQRRAALTEEPGHGA